MNYMNSFTFAISFEPSSQITDRHGLCQNDPVPDSRAVRVVSPTLPITMIITTTAYWGSVPWTYTVPRYVSDSAEPRVTVAVHAGVNYAGDQTMYHALIPQNPTTSYVSPSPIRHREPHPFLYMPSSCSPPATPATSRKCYLSRKCATDQATHSSVYPPPAPFAREDCFETASDWGER